MDSSHRYTTWRPCLLPHHHHHNPLFLCRRRHHHHHHHISPHCPLHGHLLQPNRSPLTCPKFTFPPNPEPAESVPSPNSTNQLNLQLPDVLIVQEENEELDVEDEEEPIFVLTDEWREFFAKSEAKRRLEKKQARKKGKN
ncbi:uncharacterized protein LOC132306637 [Cornus florida]|uniref:uncharacterized protein LOC132306637 n=1 Tax=Cornus florida TaxID=4283 RepID=UPI002896D4F2|nr:uncharacterized protein LOC132306637 [Cornus florida]